MVPATLAYYGYSASDVCLELTKYNPEERVVHAIDALVTAIAFARLDTVSALEALNVPRDKQGLLGITVTTAKTKRAEVVRKVTSQINDHKI